MSAPNEVGVVSETRYQWCGETLCQARSSSDTASRRYLAEGENAIALSQSFYYGIDQMANVHYAFLSLGVQSQVPDSIFFTSCTNTTAT